MFSSFMPGGKHQQAPLQLVDHESPGLSRGISLSKHPYSLFDVVVFDRAQHGLLDFSTEELGVQQQMRCS